MRDLHTNHKKSSITIIVLALVVLTGATAGALRVLNGEEQQPQKTVASSKPEVQSATTVRYTAKADKTVLEQLKITVDRVEVKESEYGEYVASINGVKGETDNKYWSYYVNGQMANIGAGEYKTIGGEEIVWKFE